MIQVFADFFQMTSLSPTESMIPPKHIYFFKSLFSQWCMVQFWSSVSEAKLYLSEELGQRVPFLVSKRKKYISCLLTCFGLKSDVHNKSMNITYSRSSGWSGMSVACHFIYVIGDGWVEKICVVVLHSCNITGIHLFWIQDMHGLIWPAMMSKGH